MLKKIEHGEKLSVSEKDLIDTIATYEPDCLAYQSERNYDGVNYLFFEHGFRKIALREVRLSLGERASKNRNTVYCAGTCDYTPYLKGYGYKFMPIAKTFYDDKYEKTDEYKLRNQVYQHFCNRKLSGQ